jgi:hypothetical protein
MFRDQKLDRPGNHMMLNPRSKDRIARWFFAITGLVLASQGAHAIWRGYPFYPNYWGGVVFAWLAVVAGLAMALYLAFYPRPLESDHGERSTRRFGLPRGFRKW